MRGLEDGRRNIQEGVESEARLGESDRVYEGTLSCCSVNRGCRQSYPNPPGNKRILDVVIDECLKFAQAMDDDAVAGAADDTGFGPFRQRAADCEYRHSRHLCKFRAA